MTDWTHDAVQTFYLFQINSCSYFPAYQFQIFSKSCFQIPSALLSPEDQVFSSFPFKCPFCRLSWEDQDHSMCSPSILFCYFFHSFLIISLTVCLCDFTMFFTFFFCEKKREQEEEEEKREKEEGGGNKITYI